jgi:hypothetical protein
VTAPPAPTAAPRATATPTGYDLDACITALETYARYGVASTAAAGAVRNGCGSDPGLPPQPPRSQRLYDPVLCRRATDAYREHGIATEPWVTVVRDACGLDL